MGVLTMVTGRWASWIALVFGVTGCTAEPWFGYDKCAPDAPLPSERCLAEAADAGTDADASDASDPGTNPQATPTCPGRCVPEPDTAPDGLAGFWSHTPVLLWVGPADVVKTMTCNDPWIQEQASVPNDKLFEKFRLYKDLDAPPAECEPCECDKPQGACPSGIPETIEIRAGTCEQSGVSTVPFEGPAGWDGSCTNENALPAGAMCGGAPCAQYVGASPLLAPTNESCAPKTTKPSFKKQTKWLTGGLACERKDYDGTCDPSSWHCVRDLPYPWQLCVSRPGIHLQCPGEYTGGRYELYGEQPLDDRECEECNCSAPTGSVCKGYLHIYEDDACSQMSTMVVPLASTDDACGKFLPAGSPAGSKSIEGPFYMPGACASTGGAPIGSAKPDPDPNTAITFCCLPSFYLPK